MVGAATRTLRNERESRNESLSDEERERERERERRACIISGSPMGGASPSLVINPLLPHASKKFQFARDA